MVIAFIDVQGFKGEHNKFIVKELALSISLTENYNFFIKSPFGKNKLSKSLQQQSTWLTNNFHFIKWNEGTYTIDHVKEILKQKTSKTKTIYVKGAEKKKWVRDIFKLHTCIVNIEDFFQCPNFTTLYQLNQIKINNITCIHSNHCALKNVICLRNFFENEMNNKNKKNTQIYILSFIY